MTFAGVDPIYDPIPVRPGAHYHMGGVETDNDGLTELTGLYAAGEVACVSVHGANRLGGNSLMETITFGRRAGPRRRRVGALAHDGRGARSRLERDAERELKALLDRDDGERPWQIRDELGELDARELRRLPPRGADAARRSRSSTSLRERYEQRRRRGQGRRLQHRPDAGDRARLPARPRRAACSRRASRARRAAARTRARTTIPTRDDENFLKHSISRWVDGAPELSYKDVRDDEVASPRSGRTEWRCRSR